MWVMFKAMSVVQKTVQPQNESSIPEIMMMGGQHPIELSLDFSEFN